MRIRELPKWCAAVAVPAFALAITGADAVHARVDPSARALCTLRAPSPPATPVRGLVEELPQYPDVSLATAAERAAARRLLVSARKAAASWHDPRVAVAAGYRAERPRRRQGDRTIGFFHAEHRRYSRDGRFLDPERPEVLIYANAPGRALVLVGVMFSVPRGVLGASPGGPITRWHSHRVCARGGERGLAPRPDGTCPPGARLRRGSEMMHLWFTPDLRSAFAIKAPEPELCAARFLPAAHCRSGRTLRTM